MSVLFKYLTLLVAHWFIRGCWILFMIQTIMAVEVIKCVDEMVPWKIFFYICFGLHMVTGFSGSSAGKESTCNAGDPCLIPGLGRSAEEGIDYPLQCPWASLVDQMVKYLSAMRESWVQSLGWDDHLEKGTATCSSILPWRLPWTEDPHRLQSMGSQRVGHDWETFRLSCVYSLSVNFIFLLLPSLVLAKKKKKKNMKEIK